MRGKQIGQFGRGAGALKQPSFKEQEFWPWVLGLNIECDPYCHSASTTNLVTYLFKVSTGYFGKIQLEYQAVPFPSHTQKGNEGRD